MRELKQGLADINKGMEMQLPAETLQAFGNSVLDLQTNVFGASSEVGVLFPSIEVFTSAEQSIDIPTAFKGKKVLISFMRGSWCPFCTLEMAHLMSYQEELSKNNVEVIVVSPMDIELLTQWKEEMNFPFTIAQDKTLRLAKALGIDFELQDFVIPHYEALGIDVKAVNQTDAPELVVPAVYLLDAQGRIDLRFLDVAYGNRLDLKEWESKF